MARAYEGRGIGDFARAMWDRWDNGDAQVEGRPDAANDAVSIITMHSAKGLEWPIVIPINSTTSLWSDRSFYHRSRDDTVHFRMFGYSSNDYELVSQAEEEELRRERIRLWYVAMTRARDLLLIPRQSERMEDDWFSLLHMDIDSLPLFDMDQSQGGLPTKVADSPNGQDLATWTREAQIIAENQRRITWHRPSRHEEPLKQAEDDKGVFVGTEGLLEAMPELEEMGPAKGGRERGLILHKLMEEVLTGETEEHLQALQSRSAELLGQLGLEDMRDPRDGPSSAEMADTIGRTLQLPVIAEIRSRLTPEFHVYASDIQGAAVTLTAGIADAVAVDGSGRIDTVIDWKSDVAPGQAVIEHYRNQLRDYLEATAAQQGFIVFLSSGHIEEIAVT